MNNRSAAAHYSPRSYSDFIRSIDARSPISSEFQIRTLSGALLSVLTAFLALYLIYTEYTYNFNTTFLDHVRVVDQSPDGLEVSFDVTFPHIPCALLAADANDPTGQGQSFHIDGKRHRVWKSRLDKNGRVRGRKSKFDLGNTLTREEQVENLRLAKEGLANNGNVVLPPSPDGDGDDASNDSRGRKGEMKEEGKEDDIVDMEANDEQECGSCYGAGDPGECCNTCDDVKRAYHRKHWHIPDVTAIAQCVHVNRASSEEGEGCNVHGFVALSTGGGNLHFAPDRQWEKEGDRDSDIFAGGGGLINLNAIMQMFDEAFEQFNVSHTVNHLSFGPSMPPVVRRSLNLVSQLDGATRTVSDGYGMFQYYLQVVPTVFRFLNGTVIETFQYSVTEHTRHVDPGSGRGLPGVFFFYEVSALHVEFEEYRRGWTHFFTGVCAAVGGAFTVMGMLDRGLFEWRTGGRGGGGSLLA